MTTTTRTTHHLLHIRPTFPGKNLPYGSRTTGKDIVVPEVNGEGPPGRVLLRPLRKDPLAQNLTGFFPERKGKNSLGKEEPAGYLVESRKRPLPVTIQGAPFPHEENLMHEKIRIPSGVELAYSLRGPTDAPVVVFIHGFLGDMEGCRVLLYDHPGHGASERPAGRTPEESAAIHSMPAFARHLDELLAALQLDQNPVVLAAL